MFEHQSNSLDYPAKTHLGATIAQLAQQLTSSSYWVDRRQRLEPPTNYRPQMLLITAGLYNLSPTQLCRACNSLLRLAFGHNMRLLAHSHTQPGMFQLINLAPAASAEILRVKCRAWLIL